MKSQMRWMAMILLVALPCVWGCAATSAIISGRQHCRHRRHQGGQGLP